MKSKLKNWIFGIVIVLILMIPIISDYYKNKDIKVINYNNYTDLIVNGDFSLVYIGDPSDKGYADVKETLLNLRNKFDVNINTLNVNKLKDSDKIALASSDSMPIEFEKGYIFIKDSEIVYVQDGEITKDRLEVLINKYYNNIIPEDEIVYKTAKDYKAYKKLVDSKKVTMAVFGYDDCQYCALYKPVFNEVAAEKKLDIYYFDSTKFDSKEYSKIVNSGLKVPASCNDGKEVSLADYDSSPLTLFTKNGKVIDCISGYTRKDALLEKLQKVGMIK